MKNLLQKKKKFCPKKEPVIAQNPLNNIAILNGENLYVKFSKVLIPMFKSEIALQEVCVIETCLKKKTHMYIYNVYILYIYVIYIHIYIIFHTLLLYNRVTSVT